MMVRQLIHSDLNLRNGEDDNDNERGAARSLRGCCIPIGLSILTTLSDHNASTPSIDRFPTAQARPSS